ncbi:hypothetical protein LEP1GSC040_3381 [Leptospira santarosai str. 2000030832]|uniref:Uncharacterized protein n=1 Tax=Leptospira santarosai serovar Arenal str. MAVJ 401 TaxID=1049976 RepID=M6JVL1_9LEPT|nr:hypothetical protein LEP1GSC040_3381 [Leptospira santarosai str. 2000030832]EMN23680.1 hypothetical protein LEP1GSC063_1409 [Leptospira santarosai serovar Arenal str. MAVJ 401]
MSSFFVFQKSIDAEHLISIFHFSRIQKRKKSIPKRTFE